MRPRRRVFACVLGTMALAVAAHAQQPAAGEAANPYLDARGGLGLDAAIARAVAQEPSLRAARADVEVARGQRQQAHPHDLLALRHRDHIGDHGERKGDRQPAVGLPDPFVPLQGNLL